MALNTITAQRPAGHGLHRDRNGISAAFDSLLGPLRHQPVTLLGLGWGSVHPGEGWADSPAPSAWLRYLPAAQVVGFGLSATSPVRHDRFAFVPGDAGEAAALERLAEQSAGFDVVIDDRSHGSYHQQLCLWHLWPYLKPGGLYIIEDRSGEIPTFGGGTRSAAPTAELFAALENGTRFDAGPLRPDEMDALRQEVSLVGSLCDGPGPGTAPRLLVLRKRGVDAVAEPEAPAVPEDDARPRVRSFDLFDTLIARRCIWPTAIFHLMEQRLGISGFAASRIAAEQAVLHDDYGLPHIYARLAADRPELAGMIEDIQVLELALEFQQIFPIAEQVQQVSPGDIIVSDMYLPFEFLQMVVHDILGLKDVWLFVTPHGKGRAEVWIPLQRRFVITDHTGDNPLSDLKSPAFFGIPGRFTRSWEPTVLEKGVGAAGLPRLGEAMREARLRQWSRRPEERDLQLLQAGVNAPMLLVATVLVLRAARQAGAEQILASGRDCYLWLKIIEQLQDEFAPGVAAHYFWTGRVPRTFPSESYKSYVRRLVGGRKSFIIDVCGTGHSLKTLCETLGIGTAQPLLIYKMKDDRTHVRNPALAAEDREVDVLALLDPSFQYDNVLVELANPAPHPTVFDVVFENGANRRVSPDWPAEPISARFGAVQEAAFVAALKPLLARPVIEELAAASSERLADVLTGLYGSYGSFAATLGAMRPEFLFENALVNTALEKMRAEQAIGGAESQVEARMMDAAE